MRVTKLTAAAGVSALVIGALLLGIELQRPAIGAPAHPMRNTAARALINDPRFAGLLSESAQRAFLPLKDSSNDLYPSPLQRAGSASPRRGGAPSTWATVNPPLAFNNDQSGFPQNEESVSSCNAGNKVIGAWNDFRNNTPGADFTGWGISTTGGTSLTNSNFLPGVTVNAGPASGPATAPGSGKTAGGGGGPPPTPASGPASGGSKEYLPSQGDPVIRATTGCTVYASSLAFQTDFTQPPASAVLVDRSDAATLASCTTEKACWPMRKPVVVSTDPSVFFDKDWMAVSPTIPNSPVSIGFTEFNYGGGFGPVISLNVVRCTADLHHCSAPIAVETDFSSPFPGPGGGASVTPTWSGIAIGSDGSTYVSWAAIQQSFGSAATVRIEEASAPPNSAAFSRPVTVTQISLPVFNPFAAENFRINGLPVIAVSHVGGVDRIHIVYAECRAVALGICEHSDVVLATSRNGQAGTWSYRLMDAAGGSDFFPTVTADQVTGKLLVGFWSTRFDPGQNAYDVVAVPVNGATGAPSPAIRISATSIEPDSDPLLGPNFIGDYWELHAVNGKAWAHYTSTQRLQQLLGEGVPVPQQDNVLSVFTF